MFIFSLGNMQGANVAMSVYVFFFFFKCYPAVIKTKPTEEKAKVALNARRARVRIYLTDVFVARRVATAIMSAEKSHYCRVMSLQDSRIASRS